MGVNTNTSWDQNSRGGSGKPVAPQGGVRKKGESIVNSHLTSCAVKEGYKS